MTDRITIDGVTYSRTVPATGTTSCEGCVANGPNAEEGTELCQAITFASDCRIKDKMWEIAKQEHKRVECLAYISSHGQVVINSYFNSDSDIEWAEKLSDRVVKVIVEIPE